MLINSLQICHEGFEFRIVTPVFHHVTGMADRCSIPVKFFGDLSHLELTDNMSEIHGHLTGLANMLLAALA